MMRDEEIIQKVVHETDIKNLMNGNIEDIERFIYTIIGESLIEQGDLEDEID